MNAADVLIWLLRLFGALYLVGGVWMARQMLFWARIGGSVEALAEAVERFDAETHGRAAQVPARDDVGRSWWLFVGATMLAVAGASMLLGHRATPLLLALLIAQQLLYFMRQHRRERRAATPADALKERPNAATINGFYGAVAMTGLAAWLGWQGALWG